MTNTMSSKRKRRMAREPKAEGAKVQAEATAHDTPETSDEIPASPKEPSKTEKVFALLKRAEGATLDELVEAIPASTRRLSRKSCGTPSRCASLACLWFLAASEAPTAESSDEQGDRWRGQADEPQPCHEEQKALSLLRNPFRPA